MEASYEQEGGGNDLDKYCKAYLTLLIHEYKTPAAAAAPAVDDEKLLLTLNYVGSVLYDKGTFPDITSDDKGHGKVILHTSINKIDSYGNNAEIRAFFSLPGSGGFASRPKMFKTLVDTAMRNVYNNIVSKLSAEARFVLSLLAVKKGGEGVVQTFLSAISAALKTANEGLEGVAEGTESAAAAAAAQKKAEAAMAAAAEATKAAAKAEDERSAAEETGSGTESAVARTRRWSMARSTFRLRRQNQTKSQKQAHQKQSQQKTAKNH